MTKLLKRAEDLGLGDLEAMSNLNIIRIHAEALREGRYREIPERSRGRLRRAGLIICTHNNHGMKYVLSDEARRILEEVK